MMNTRITNHAHSVLLALLTIFALTMADSSYGKEKNKHTILKAAQGVEYPGGDKAMSKWIDEHLFRPTDEQGNLIEGYVDVKATFGRAMRGGGYDGKRMILYVGVASSTDERLNFDAMLAVRSLKPWNCSSRLDRYENFTAVIRVYFNKESKEKANAVLNADTTVYDWDACWDVCSRPAISQVNWKNYVDSVMKNVDFIKEKGYAKRHDVSFIVEADGRISNVHSECKDKSTAMTKYVDQTIMSAIKSMPRWMPALKNWNYVRCKLNFQEFFYISDANGQFETLDYNNPTITERPDDLQSLVYHLAKRNIPADLLDTIIKCDVSLVVSPKGLPQDIKVKISSKEKNHSEENELIILEARNKIRNLLEERGWTPAKVGKIPVSCRMNATVSLGEPANKDLNDDMVVFDVVEHMPQFPGGPSALFNYLSTNIQYPKVAEENGVQGRVFVRFVIEIDGSITDVKVTKSVDPSLDKEAVRVVKSMPRWKPGMQSGKPVRVRYTMPLTFKLR